MKIVGREAGLALASAFVALALAAPAQATFPGANGKIFFSGQAVIGGELQGGIDIFSVNADGSDLVNVTDSPGGAGGGEDPSVSGDGSTVAFTKATGGDTDIWTMNADGSNPVRLTDSTALPIGSKLDTMPGISPDGSRIVFMSTRDTPDPPIGLDFDIWIMNADGSGQELLLDGFGEDYRPEFAPDGEMVGVASEVTGDLDIAYVPATGGPFTSATTITGMSNERENTFSIRPDQVRVAYSKQDTGQYDLHDAYFDGTDEFPIAEDPAVNESEPSYSPDLTKLVFRKGGELMVSGIGGSNAAPLPLDPAQVVNVYEPAWAVGEPEPPATDTTPPETTVTKQPKKKLKRPKASIGFISTEPLSTFECKLDKGEFASCTSPRKLKRLKPKRHRFEVRATDSSGNTDQSPAFVKFKVAKKKL